MKLAIIDKEKCKPTACGHECKKYCPVEKKELDSCVTVGGPSQGVPSSNGDKSRSLTGKAVIDEGTCVGCAICVRRCPFGAIDIVNLPSVDEDSLVHRYGQNGFALYGLPIPKQGSVLGLLGRNGIGKSTAVRLLAGAEKINLGKMVESQNGLDIPHPKADGVDNSQFASAQDSLNTGKLAEANCSPTPKGREATLRKSVMSKFGEGDKKDLIDADIKEFFKGNEILRYLESLNKKKVAYKPQNLSQLAVDVKVMDLLLKRGEKKEILELAGRLGVLHILENKMNKLSGGELQKAAILAASLGDADIYFFDEPLAFLDIGERLLVSDFLKEISKEKTLIVVEHDLLILDYLTDYLNIFYGGQGAFGCVSGVKGSKEGVNAYLHGFLKEENLRIRDKELNFNFTKNASMSGLKIAEWPDFEVRFGEEGFGANESSSLNKSLDASKEGNMATGLDIPRPKADGVGSHPKVGEASLRKFVMSKPESSSGFKLKVKSGEIRQNHVTGILGRNGTGKTSFIKALVGELETSVGKLDLDLKISYKPQYLFSEDENLVRDICFKEKITKKMKSLFNLGVLENKKVKELSGGELQRFAVARCLAREADVYLIDEPSAYLDVEERISVAKSIKDIMVEKEKTAFVVDHDLLLVSYLADSIINFDGEPGRECESSEVRNFEDGVSELLKSLDVTLRKDKESGRPRINKKGSVLDREQKEKGEWAVF